MSFPPTVQNIVIDQVKGQMPVAWLRVDNTGILQASGGDLGQFGFGDLVPGQRIQEQAVLMEVLFSGGPVDRIDSIHLDNGDHADARVVVHDGEVWIVLLGRTADSRWRGIAQQKSNELTLLQEQLARRVASEGALDLAGMMGLLVFEAAPGGLFRLVQPVSDAAALIYPALASGQSEFALDQDFPYLTTFLDDARKTWQGKSGDRTKSGPWVEVAATGLEYALEATAICWQDRPILVIEQLEGSYQKHLAVLQHGRENLLIKRQLERELARQKELERKLLDERAKADRASQAKSEFVSAMSHELRTPLNAVLGFAQVLRADPATPLTAVQKDRVEHIIASGRHLLDLINQVLELSKIEAGEMDLTISPVPSADAIEAVLPMVRMLAQKQQVTVSYEPRADTVVAADLTRLKQVMINLVSNAVKYNRPAGKVTIEERVIDGERVRLSVTDTGVGIPPDRRAELFTPFSRLGRERSNVEGAGVGLVVTKTIVDRMGGKISFESTEGVGSTFWVELPIARPARVAE